MVAVQYVDIGIAYGDFIVCQHLDLDIEDGEITTLLGPSGCGKTTLLRSLAGFVEPFQGRIHMDNKDITELPPQKRNTAMIFQNYALWPHMNVFRNIEYGLKLRSKDKLKDTKRPWYARFFWLTKPVFWFHKQTFVKVGNELKEEKTKFFNNRNKLFASLLWPFKLVFRGIKLIFEQSTQVYYDKKASVDPHFKFRRDKVFKVLQLVHLENQAYKSPPQLSGGQQQRIALCRAIVVEPDILLCDEPLSNLDAKLRSELRTEIRSIIKNIGITAVYVTHDQEEALAISDKIAIMHEGNIEQYGDPIKVFNDPQTLFVAQFIGESTTINGKVTAEETITLEGGEVLKIKTKEKLPKATDLQIVIRPEDVKLVQENGYHPIEFEINTIEYLGVMLKLTGKLKDGTILLVDVEKQPEAYTSLKVGNKLTGYVKPEAIFVFKDNQRVY